MKIRVFTDGAFCKDKNIGGWAVLFAHEKKYEVHSGKISGGSNNHAELFAVVKALEHIEKENKKYEIIEIYTDASYVINNITNNNIVKWYKNAWQTKKKKLIKNACLWDRLYNLFFKLKQKEVDIKFIKVKAHSGNMFNDMVDQLAKKEINIIKK